MHPSINADSNTFEGEKGLKMLNVLLPKLDFPSGISPQKQCRCLRRQKGKLEPNKPTVKRRSRGRPPKVKNEQILLRSMILFF